MSVSHKGVRGGTPQGKPLCPSCVHSSYIKGSSETHVILKCGAFYRDLEMPFEATECNQYRNGTFVSLYELKKIAWVVVPKTGGRVGFAPPPPEKEEDK